MQKRVLQDYRLTWSRTLLKTLLVMKLAIIAIFVTALSVKGLPLSGQNISLNVKQTEIKKVLKTIENDGNYRFLYNSELKGLKNKVDFSAQDLTIDESLSKLFSGSHLTFKKLDNNVIVVLSANEEENDKIKVTGRVLSESGEAVAGASVVEKGTKNGTFADNGGVFNITVENNATLMVSSIGYDAQEVKVDGRSVIEIRLKASASKTDEVVVIGYGTASKRDLTGSIVKLSGKEVADRPNTNPVASLQGKVAGLSVVNNGIPGSQPDIRIRGTVSMGSVNPLFVVDGIFTDNIDYLNNSDIESIEVLKDPSSLAIFGVKGASGVIAITTKKAKAGQITVNFNSTYGVKQLVDKIELANGDDFKKIFAMEAANGLDDNDPTIGIKNTGFLNNEMSKWTGNTDWIDAITRTAGYSNTNLSVSGASERNKYYLAFGYNTDQGLVKHVEYQKTSINFSDEFKVNSHLKLGVNLIGSKEKLPNDGSYQMYDARKTLPIINSGTKSFWLHNPYGSQFDSANYNVYSGVPVIQNTEHNPLMSIEQNWNKTINDQYRGVGSIFAELNFLKNFNLKVTYYSDLTSSNRRSYQPLYYAYNPAATNASNQAYLVNNTTAVYQNDNNRVANQRDYILTYKKNLNGHSFTATGGVTTYEIRNRWTSAESKQKAGDQPIPDDPRFYYISNGFSIPGSPKSDQWEYSTISALGRLLYNYKGKYYFTGSFRKDYASNISQDYANKGQNFWALGAAWELTKENFMKDQKIFDYLKLKISTGVLGNFNTGTIGGYYPAYPGLNYSNAQFGVNTVSIASPNYLADPNLKWETVNASEIGVEFNAIKNKLHGEISYYNKRTKNLLALLKPSGVLPTLTNSGEISNKGLEFSATWNQNITKDLSLSVSGNLTTYKNEVISLNYPIPADPQYPNQTETGKPIGYFYGYVVEGLYQSYADVLASPVNTVNGGGAKPGDFKYKDLNGDGKIDDNDKTDIGNPTPDFTYGGNVTLKYKNFDLNIDVVGSYGNEIYRYWSTSEQKNSVYNYPKYLLNAWNGAGTSNWIPIVDAQHLINRAPSTFGIEDGSYFRIRSFGIGYNLDSKLIAKAKIKAARVFFNVQNLKTWKNNLGYSPEYGGSATSFGIDTGGAEGALPRITSFGFNLTF